MQEIINCPSCHRKLQVPAALLGQDVQCPTCGASFVAGPAGGQGPPPMPPQGAPQYGAPPQSYPGSASPPYGAPQPVYGQPYAQPQPRREYPREGYDDDEFDDDDDDDDYRPRRRHRPRGRRGMMPHRGSTVLTLGILSVVGIASIILGPIAWTMGSADLAEMRAGRMDPEGEGSTTTGRTCGIIGTILGIVFMVFCVLLMPFWIGTRGFGPFR